MTKELGCMYLQARDQRFVRLEFTREMLEDDALISKPYGLSPPCSCKVGLAIRDGGSVLIVRIDPSPSSMALRP